MEAKVLQLVVSRKVEGPKPLFKRCGCCGRCYTRPQWNVLPYGGRIVTEDASGARYVAILRHCSCRSTIAVERPMSPTEVA